MRQYVAYELQLITYDTSWACRLNPPRIFLPYLHYANPNRFNRIYK